MPDNFQYPPLAVAAMMLETTDKTILVVEGHSDKRFFNNVVNKKEISLLFGDGRDNVCNIINSLLEKFPSRISGICDSDLLFFEIGNHTGTEIYHTDNHDLEMDALKSSDLSPQLNMRLNPDKLEKATLSVTDLINKIFEMTILMGCFRLACEKFNYNLKFKDDLSLKKGVDYGSNFELELENTVRSIINQNGGGFLLSKVKEILQKINVEVSEIYDKFQICNGHDFVYFLREVLKEFGARGSSKIPSHEELTDTVLGIYTLEQFKTSNLGKNLVKKGYLK